jgi:thiamine-monophosphate kinase
VCDSPTLGDLGERQIVQRILPKYSVGIGNDCAVVSVDTSEIVITTDPVPQPAAKVIANDPDLFWMGWLLVTINASDLAAAGACPLAFVSAIEAPPALAVREFERLLDGIKQGCMSEGLQYVGGNLREAQTLAAVGTAIGTSRGNRLLTRKGANIGDVLVSIGPGGIFWRDALIFREFGICPDKELSPLFKPSSQLHAMEALNRAGLITAAIDNSDGLLPTLSQLSTMNSVQIVLDLEKLTVPIQNKLGVDPARLWLGWGDWNVIATVRSSDIERFDQLAKTAGLKVSHIGEVIPGDSAVVLKRGNHDQIAPRLESERFVSDSWFREGIDGYVRRLLSAPLPGSQS